ncbi:hypothetical protein Q0Z83_042870 [Actinoplanes sichuanensis]|uniref:Uncharacterized protein n=1 Tax=Actinoplanes sichuanensis TaxID=512349 RepID=A0ABW4AUJ0_9ACTN|nr:hypothetical protein [Actinoplanes sichuanensis]BEL06096.1 hypothetical protein Q0Z83_042870 [Actinoplanes sichuanensis]
MNENAEQKILTGLLRHIADNSDNEVLREFAGEALRGNIDVADGMAFSAYAEALAPHVDGFMQWRDGLSETEREKQIGDCAAQLERLEEQLAEGADDGFHPRHEHR